MNLKYKLTFLDYWHLSSGLSAGAKFDSSVVKDKDSLPYASGKTIKGLIREMVEEFEDVNFMHQSYFSNAIIHKDERDQIVLNNIQDNLYDVIASTKIENGIAVDASLREIEVVIPISLYGEIRDIPDNKREVLQKSLQLIKRMGLNRNRGLGRCMFEIVEEL